MTASIIETNEATALPSPASLLDAGRASFISFPLARLKIEHMDWTQLVAELSEFAETTRRDGRYWWSFTERGDLHEAKRGYDNIVEAANEADTYRRQRELARHISAKRIATSQSL